MSDDPIKTDQEYIILSVKLPVRCLIFGLLSDALAKKYGPGVLTRQVGNYLEFILPPGYEQPERDNEF